MVSLLRLYTPTEGGNNAIKCILLCIPWAGGNGAYYRSWLPDLVMSSEAGCACGLRGVQILSLNLAGRAGTDPALEHNMEVTPSLSP